LYGNDDVTALAQRFNVDVRQSIRAFREYLDNGGKRFPEKLKPLMTAIDTVPVYLYVQPNAIAGLVR